MNNMDNLLAKVEELTLKVESIQKAINQKVKWQAQVSDGGIQIVGGATTVEKTGTLMSSHVIPAGPGQINVLFLVKEDNGMMGLVEAGLCKFVD